MSHTALAQLARRIACALAWEEFIDAPEAGSKFEDHRYARQLLRTIEEVLNVDYADEELALREYGEMFSPPEKRAVEPGDVITINGTQFQVVDVDTEGVQEWAYLGRMGSAEWSMKLTIEEAERLREES